MRFSRLVLPVAFLAVVLVLGSAAPASANCEYGAQRQITTYYGYFVEGGVTCVTIFGPWLPPDIIGQDIRECDGSTWGWGDRTECTARGEDQDVTYEDCPPICDDIQPVPYTQNSVQKRGSAAAAAKARR